MNRPLKKKQIKQRYKFRKFVLMMIFVLSFVLLFLFGDFSTFILLQIAGLGGCFYDRY